MPGALVDAAARSAKAPANKASGVVARSVKQSVMARKLMRWLVIAIVAMTVAACSGQPRQRPSFEAIDPREDLIDVLGVVPTDFKVEPGDDAHSWERVLFFFKKHAGKFRLSQDSDEQWSYQISSAAAQDDALHFSVRKRFYRGTYLYKVICQPNPAASRKMSIEMAMLNARNLARFIREGKLEASLLSGEFPEGLFTRRK